MYHRLQKLSLCLQKTVTFVASTTGSQNTHNLFKVTGVVAMSVFGVCKTSLAGASATIKVGTAISDAAMIAQTTATNIAENEIWHDSTPDASIELTSILTQKIVTQNIIYTIGTAAISAGVIDFYVLWEPISPDGKVELI